MRLWIALAAVAAELVLAWAARDALFLSQLDVTRLPWVFIAAGGVAVLVAIAVARAVTTHGPRRILMTTLCIGAGLHLVLWFAAKSAPAAAAFLLFVQTEVIGSVLFAVQSVLLAEKFAVRGFQHWGTPIMWSALAGVAIGGFLADRIGASGGSWMALPVLAGLQLVAVIGMRLDTANATPSSKSAVARAPLLAAPRAALLDPYMRGLIVAVVIAASAAIPLEYAFKSRVAAHYAAGEDLLRFFARYYAITTSVTFALQPFLGRMLLERVGLGPALATLPAAVLCGALPALAVPGLWTAALARGFEFMGRRGGFRPAYDVLYTPVSTKLRRSTSAFVDVCGERLGEALGGGLVIVILLLAPATDVRGWVAVAIGLAAVMFVATRRLGVRYVAALEDVLARRAGEIDAADVTERTTRALVSNLRGADLRHTWHESSLAVPVDELRRLLRESPQSAPTVVESEAVTPGFALEELSSPPALSPEVVADCRDNLRSGDATRIARTLRTVAWIDRTLVPDVLPLLADNATAPDAVEALRRSAPFIVGSLVDVLLDPSEVLAVRRRLPRIIAQSASQRAMEGLFQGLDDARSEIRLQCGRALARLHVAHPEIPFERERVMSLVLEEARRGKRVWESQQQLDHFEDPDDSPLVDEVLRDRANRSLEHVFALLSLVLPLEPLRSAFAGLHTDHEMLRGTALEYLESVLPAHVRGSLWPLLAERNSLRPGVRQSQGSFSDLVESNQSIQINLEELRRRLREGGN